MATVTKYFYYTSGSNVYAKPLPLTTSPWSTGVINANENGSTGQYAISVDDSTEYFVYKRSGASPASSDGPPFRMLGASAGQDYGDQLDAIQTKTDLITSAGVTISQPTNATGQFATDLIIGDDYLAANGREIYWTFTKPTGTTIASSTCKLGFKRVVVVDGVSTTYELVVTGTVTDAGSGNVKCSFDITKTQSAKLTEGDYDWSLEYIGDAGEEITSARHSKRGKARWVSKQT